MNVELWPITRPQPYLRNPRKNAAAVDKVALLLKEYGWQQPIVVDSEGVILAGHTRLLAAQKLGLTDVPVVVASGLTAEQAKAYRLADNRSNEDATWDKALLSVELADLFGAGFDLSLTAFSADELDGLEALYNTTRAGLVDEDDVPKVQTAVVSQLGDVWVLGEHRVLCGDSTDANAVTTLLGSAKPHLMVTDPPYGVEYSADWRSKALRDGSERAEGKVLNDAQADWCAAWSLFPGDVIYVWQGDKQITDMARQLADNGFVCRNLIVWAKSQFVISRGDYHHMHETCWYAVRKGATGHWAGDRKQATLWRIDKPERSETGHSTQKPVDCMRRPIENNSKAGDAVYDPFLGSGTTVIAAELTGRRCYGMELSPAYVDVIVRRWQEFTGKQAVREDGSAFQAAA
jgi:DNA modification methylase